uniref:Uncharacterized protein n=1 Tax=Ditylenchus dipsaci TaxID=166011 RepID=A0A915DLT4_9BILA
MRHANIKMEFYITGITFLVTVYGVHGVSTSYVYSHSDVQRSVFAFSAEIATISDAPILYFLSSDYNKAFRQQCRTFFLRKVNPNVSSTPRLY